MEIKTNTKDIIIVMRMVQILLLSIIMWCIIAVFWQRAIWGLGISAILGLYFENKIERKIKKKEKEEKEKQENEQTNKQQTSD